MSLPWDPAGFPKDAKIIPILEKSSVFFLHESLKKEHQALGIHFAGSL